MCKGLFSWENTGKKVICETLMHEAKSWQPKHAMNANMPLGENQTLAHRHELAMSISLIYHVKGSFFLRKHGKIGKLWKFDLWSKILTGKRHDNITPLYANQTLTLIHQFAIPKFLIHRVKGSLFLRKRRKNGRFGKFSIVKPTLDGQNMWYYHTNILKSNLGSQASIGFIYFFDSPCARVFFPEKTQDK